jgi:hypothetical protein
LAFRDRDRIALCIERDLASGLLAEKPEPIPAGDAAAGRQTLITEKPNRSRNP